MAHKRSVPARPEPSSSHRPRSPAASCGLPARVVFLGLRLRSGFGLPSSICPSGRLLASLAPGTRCALSHSWHRAAQVQRRVQKVFRLAANANAPVRRLRIRSSKSSGAGLRLGYSKEARRYGGMAHHGDGAILLVGCPSRMACSRKRGLKSPGHRIARPRGLERAEALERRMRLRDLGT